ncbi:hypothetical protein F2Q69_00045063 [Brassica cretica]|uniref:AAA+ ATPase domain-containing protein n=1 Tax=Brassica cretica TaxID=69181 RepID=A0A8S9NFG2_BRACR|nr:hypothetical protein F2Q69_00045063 [Brassica cretica]
MVCEMETDQIEEMDVEVLSSMWPDDVGTQADNQFNVEKPAGDSDTLKEVDIAEKRTMADLKRLPELLNTTDQGSSQLTNLVRQWEYMQDHAVRLLREELKILTRQREEAEAKELKIIEEHNFETEEPENVPVLDETSHLFRRFRQKKRDELVDSKRVVIDEEFDTVAYWKQKALSLEKMLEASTERERRLIEKLNESLKTMESHSAPVEELTQNLKRAEGFLHFILQNAPIVMGHQDKDLRYLKEEILNDLEAFSNGKEYYKKIGKAWKRGYLLYGPPGTGKSTMIAAMANHLNYNIYDLELTAIQNNSELRKLLTATSSRSIIVIEDIDCSVDLTGKRRKRDGDLSVKKDGEDQNQSRVTLSGLLNFIDGIWSACGQERIIIFTTNHIEKLDPALIRRGRMDMHIELSYCSFEAFKVLAKNYLDVDSHLLFGEIESLLKETKIAPADVAEKLMAKNHKVDVDGSLKDLVESLEKRKKQQRDHGDDHKKKLSGKKLRIFRELF